MLYSNASIAVMKVYSINTKLVAAVTIAEMPRINVATGVTPYSLFARAKDLIDLMLIIRPTTNKGIAATKKTSATTAYST